MIIARPMLCTLVVTAVVTALAGTAAAAQVGVERVTVAAAAGLQDGPAARRQTEQRAQETGRQAQQRARAARREAQERARQQRDEIRERAASNRRNWPDATEPFARTVRLERGAIVDIENINGDITITGGGGNDVRIDATRRMRHPNQERARALLPELRVAVVERPGRLEIRTEHPRVRGAVGEVTYTLTVPSGAGVVVKTISGDVRVSNIRGELRAQTVSGNLITTSAARIHTAKTVSGNIEISGAEDDISAGSLSGSVTLRGVKARSARLETVSGDVRLAEVELDRADVGTMSGDIDYTGRLARAGRYELHTHSGDIRVTPVSPSGLDVEASTLNGDVLSEFDLALSSRGGAGGRGTSQTVRGSYGDGGAVISLRSFNGDITIVKR
jgi:DUF4097 and DUF4098 domain-containing protein YvlB